MSEHLEFHPDFVSSEKDGLPLHLRSSIGVITSAEHPLRIELKDYQIAAWDALYKHRQVGEGQALVHMATGLGKTTVVAGDILTFGQEFEAQYGQKPKVLFMAHQVELLRQAGERCAGLIPSYNQSHVFAGQFDEQSTQEADIVFATLQSMSMKKEQFPSTHFDYVVVDESHHSMAPVFEKTITYFRPSFRLGVTATPFRKDQRDVMEVFGKIVYQKSLAEAVSDKILDPPQYEVVADDLLRMAVDTDFTRNRELREALYDVGRNKAIAKQIQDKQRTISSPRTIIFAQNIAHAEDFTQYMPGAVALHSELTPDERQAILAAFRTGQLNTIVAIDMLNEGVDIPEANLAVFLRSTASRTVFEQQLGRILRKMSGKESHVLDFVGTAERLRMIYDLSEEVRKINETKARALGIDSDDEEFIHSRYGTFIPEFNAYGVNVIERIRELTRSEELAPEGWMNIGQIADAIQRSTFYVYPMLRSMNIQTKKFRTPANYAARYISPQDAQAFIDMFENPLGYVSIDDLSIILGMSDSYVAEYIVKNAIETLPFATKSGMLAKHVSPKDAEIIIERHIDREPPADWVSITKLRVEHELSRLAVRRVMRRLGVEAKQYSSKENNQMALHISLEDAASVDEYLNPRGWVSLRDMGELCGNTAQAVKHRAVRMNIAIEEKMSQDVNGKPLPSLHVRESDARRLLDYFESRAVEIAPEHVISLISLSEEIGVERATLKATVRRMEIRITHYKTADSDRRSSYVSQEDAQKLREYYVNKR